MFIPAGAVQKPLGGCSPFVLAPGGGTRQQGGAALEPAFDPAAAPRIPGPAAARRILGIDPGLRNLGWGVVEARGNRLRHIANGVCRSEGDDLATRLLSLHRQLTAVLIRHAPDCAAVEQTFVNKDAVATLKLGHARAVALLVPAQAGLVVGEYAPNAVKKAVVGVGHAAKVQVAHMVRLALPGAEIAGPDAADALAVAICHAFQMQTGGRLSAAIAGARAAGR